MSGGGACLFQTDHKVVLVLWLEHGGHFLQVGLVLLLLHYRWEEDRDDLLSDVGQIEVIASLHHFVHHLKNTVAAAPEEETKDELVCKWSENCTDTEEEQKKLNKRTVDHNNEVTMKQVIK